MWRTSFILSKVFCCGGETYRLMHFSNSDGLQQLHGFSNDKLLLSESNLFFSYLN